MRTSGIGQSVRTGIALGLCANWQQFSLLVLIDAFFALRAANAGRSSAYA